jgi:hypothetical protein
MVSAAARNLNRSHPLAWLNIRAAGNMALRRYREIYRWNLLPMLGMKLQSRHPVPVREAC